jgi:hypothetical protein
MLAAGQRRHGGRLGRPVLAAEGADLLAKDNNGDTPLDAAMGRMRGAGGRAASVVNVYKDTAAVIEQLIEAAERQ